MKKNSIVRQLLFYLLVIGAIVLLGSMLYSKQNTQEAPTYDDILNYFYEEQVREVEITSKNVLKLKVVVDGAEQEVSYKLRDYGQFYYDLGDLIAEQSTAQPKTDAEGNVEKDAEGNVVMREPIITKYEPHPAAEMPIWVSFPRFTISFSRLYAVVRDTPSSFMASLRVMERWRRR